MGEVEELELHGGGYCRRTGGGPLEAQVGERGRIVGTVSFSEAGSFLSRCAKGQKEEKNEKGTGREEAGEEGEEEGGHPGASPDTC